jgi:hypothetical protein
MYGNVNTRESRATLAEMLMMNPEGMLLAAHKDSSGSLKKKIEVIT